MPSRRALDELEQFRKGNGRLGWLVNQLRLDLAFGTSVSQQEVKEPTVRSLLDLNLVIKKARAHKDFAFWYRYIDLDTAGVVGVCDASHGDLKGYHSQYGCLVMIAHKDLIDGKCGNFGPVEWTSSKHRRVVRSSYASELLGCTAMTDAVDFQRALMKEVKRVTTSTCGTGRARSNRSPVSS